MQDLPHRYNVTANTEAEVGCLITNSLSAESHLETNIMVAA